MAAVVSPANARSVKVAVPFLGSKLTTTMDYTVQNRKPTARSNEVNELTGDGFCTN
jgi:hypothetical protein